MKLLPDSFDKNNRRHIGQLHNILEFLGEKVPPDSDDAIERRFGATTSTALAKVKNQFNLPQTDSLNKTTIQTLNQKAIEKYFASRTQTASLHRKLVRVGRIAGLEYNLSADMKARNQGTETGDALKAFQKKYGLAQTGKLNKETLERIESVAASRVAPFKKLKVPRTERLMKVRNPLRLNMQRSKVADLQRALAWMGYEIDVKEADAQTYGKTTRKAVIAFQTAQDLPVSGNVGWKTAQKINNLIEGNSNMVSCKDKYRIRGSVRNDLWEGVKLAAIQVFEKKLRGEALLGERKTLANGFYDLQYLPPVNPLTGKPKENFLLLFKMLDSQGKLLQEKTFQVTGKVLWVNFTDGKDRYRGDADFQALEKALNKALGSHAAIGEIEESDVHQDVTYLRKETFLAAEDIMKMTLAFRTSAAVNLPALTPEVFYAFIRQNQPQSLPGDLLPDNPQEWSVWIAMLVERCAEGIAFLAKDLQEDLLQSGLKQNYVSRRVAKDAPQILATLAQLKTVRVLKKPVFGGGPLQTLLEASAIDAQAYASVAECLSEANGFNQGFWQSLRNVSGLSSVEANDFRTTVDLGYMTSNFSSLLAFLKNKIAYDDTASLKQVSDCARLSKDEWLNLIKQNSGQIPSWVKGKTVFQKKQAYAASLKEKAGQLFPAIALIAEVDRSKKHALGSVANILALIESEPNFDLRKDNLGKFFATAGAALTSHEMAATRALQRINRIASSAETGVALLESGYYSAAQVCREGRDVFISAMGKKNISANDARAIYEDCAQKHATVMAALGEFRFDLQRINPDCVASQTYSAEEIEELKKDIPDIETLFGPVDVREVRHGDSVLGPSAYLTDLFRFLSQKKSKVSGKTVRDILFQRRPDLGNIKLNCKNTDTALPYIDLVCEILENRVLGGSGVLNFQSTWPAEDLLAEPEHVEADAYEKLKTADYPLHAHFNLWQEEPRALLAHLGIPRWQLMDTFLIDANDDLAKNNHCNSAAEYFSISDQEQQIILTPRATKPWQKKYWSDDVVGNEAPVSVFLQKSGLNYRQLFDLLQCEFVNGSEPKSFILCPLDNCDLDLQQVKNLTMQRLDKMNRFLRLWKKTGLELWELDLVLMSQSIGKGLLNNDFLIRLRQFAELRKTLKLGVEACAALLGPINTRSRSVPSSEEEQPKNLFENLFLSGSVDPQTYADFALLLTAAATSKNLEPYRAHVQSALSLNNKEFNLLLPLTNAMLTRDSLGILFRYKTLAGKLKLKLDDFLLLCRLVGGAEPFASLESVKRIVEKKQLIGESGATLAQLAYLLEYDPDSPSGWREEMYVQKIQGLREALAGLREKIIAAEDAGDDSLAMLLGLLTPFADTVVLKTMVDIIAGAWAASEAEITNFISDHLSSFVADIAKAVNTLKSPGPLSQAELTQRRSYVMTELLNYLNRTTVKECVAAALSMESSHASVLLNSLHLPGSSHPLLTVLQDEKLHARDGKSGYLYEISSADLPDVFAACHLLHKAALALQGLKCTADELTWLIAHPAAGTTLDFNLLPIRASQSAVALDAWLNLWRFLKFKRLFPEPENASFWTVLEIAADPAGSATDVNGELCKLTGWDLVAHETLHYEQLDYCSPKTYEWFLECHRQQKIAGVDFGLLFGWARRDLAHKDQTNAVAVRDMVKAKYSREQWLKILKPIMDDLREKKRQALTAYLVERSQREKPLEISVGGKKVRNHEYWTSPDDLYSWFLIDVEMCADQLTSRILQAILSTQLYVQRCFLNLENRDVEVALPDPDIENSWDQWKWMKNYRVWEANRKVFLFPENWIEPELRDTKSPFFEELESDILSREATNDNVEAALQRYIQKLEEVSRLGVCSIYHEKGGPTNLLHVIARTRSVPAIFYYRTYDLNYSRWSPWEKIETDIQSDHVVPWIYNRKLHLFWLTIQEKPIKLKQLPPVKADTPSQTPDPAMFLEIELSWSVRQHEGWDARKTGKKKLVHPWQRPLFSYNLKPRYKADRNCLYIDLYISTSREFNEGVFYDQFKHDKVRLTKVHYDETLRPWHSSSFVFDGNVREVLLRGIPGYYFSPEAGDVRNIDSYQYVKENFSEGGDIAPLGIISEQLALPSGMHYRYTRLSNNRNRSVNPCKLNVFGPDKKTKTILNNASDPFEAVLCQQGLAPVNGKIRPVLYQDQERSFFITQNRQESFWSFPLSNGKTYGVYPFYHPFTEVFQQEINRGGVETFYRRNLQINPHSLSGRTPFTIAAYSPVTDMDFSAAEKEQLDFSRSGAYSIYNWELFFHVPLMIACRLSQNQRFEEAMQWFHYIFDPTNTQMLPTPQRFWVTKPFHETNDAEYRKQRIKNIIENIGEFKEQLIEWKNHPFLPHLIAEHRTVAYQRTVVMKYLDNLIAWGDQLFRQDTMESINEATLFYILAHELLGRRPVLVPALNREEKTFNELVAESALDDFGNAKVEVALENTLGLPIQYDEPVFSTDEEAPSLEISYYGLPHNDKLLQYWDTVADRLFKIRHGLNIQGLKRSLPLFEPPIDPALLVKAAAAGLDLAAVLNDMNAPAQAYRFKVLAAKAIDFCRDVKSLGDQLLKALERKDAEEMAVLQASDELNLIHRMHAVKKLRVDEFQYAFESIERRREASQIKIDHIKSLSEPLEAEEKAGDWSTAADVFKVLSKVSSVGAMIASLFPDVKTGANGAGGSPEATVKIGGSNVRKGFEYAGKAMDAAAELCKWRQDSLKSEAAGERTKADREAAIAQEEKVIADLAQQKLANEILQQIAELELENFEKEMELRQAEYEYLRDKYTNRQLYQWMLTQIATVYFQAYQLAYDMAKRAEKSYRRELGLTDSNFIQFGYWDSLKKGLLSADRLTYDIRRMEAAYLDQHRREQEITKHVSLARLMPDKLLELTATGRCTLDLQEWMYNLDYPGHYRRRIKSVSVSIPCEADEFTNVNCRLTLSDSEVRISNVVGDSGYGKDPAGDIRFITQPGTGESIATSHGEYDNGLFELKFDDERFLPFEGAGAISSWDIHMPREHNQFDFSTMTDFILHVSYTAQEGGEALGAAAKAQLDEILPGSGMLLVGLKYGFPAAWEAFLHPSPAGSEQKLSFTIVKEHYPFLGRSSSMTLTKVGLVVSGNYGGNYNVRMGIPGQGDTDCLLSKDGSLNNMHHKPDVFEGTAPATGPFSVMVRRDTAGSGDFSSLPPDDLNHVILILHYEK